MSGPSSESMTGLINAVNAGQQMYQGLLPEIRKTCERFPDKSMRELALGSFLACYFGAMVATLGRDRAISKIDSCLKTARLVASSLTPQEAGFAAPRLLAGLALLVLALGSAMASSNGPLGPHGHALPAWVRIVDRDGQVLDLTVIEVSTITMCPRSGSTDIWSPNEGTGMAMIDTGTAVIGVSYAVKYYNEGGVTGNPDTTGDQLLLIEDPDILHSDGGGEGCVRYAYGETTP